MRMSKGSVELIQQQKDYFNNKAKFVQLHNRVGTTHFISTSGSTAPFFLIRKSTLLHILEGSSPSEPHAR